MVPEPAARYRPIGNLRAAIDREERAITRGVVPQRERPLTAWAREHRLGHRLRRAVDQITASKVLGTVLLED